MSFLGDKIKSVIQVTREAKDEFDSDIVKKVTNEINGLKALIENSMDQLKTTKDLRIFDSSNGGCLRGYVNGRKKYESGQKLLCDKKYMEYGKNDTPSEVPYMRALFNTRKIGAYDIISYETPFMRKQTEDQNKEISGRALSCDLLGAKSKELCCIEVKIVPDNDATNLPFALLEGFSYAVCLNWLLNYSSNNGSKELYSEIQLCCNDFGFPESLYAEPFEKATFAIAGPIKEYFSPYATKTVTKMMKNHSEEWFNRRIKESKIIQQIILKEFPGWFVGYMTLSQSVEDCTYLKTHDDQVVEPIFRNHSKTFSSLDKMLIGLS